MNAKREGDLWRFEQKLRRSGWHFWLQTITFGVLLVLLVAFGLARLLTPTYDQSRIFLVDINDRGRLTVILEAPPDYQKFVSCRAWLPKVGFGQLPAPPTGEIIGVAEYISTQPPSWWVFWRKTKKHYYHWMPPATLSSTGNVNQAFFAEAGQGREGQGVIAQCEFVRD